jgi:hypothetical protein
MSLIERGLALELVANEKKKKKKLDRGFEPRAAGLQDQRSTTELNEHALHNI